MPTAPPVLSLAAPSQIEYAGRSTPVGATVYRALQALLVCNGRVTTVAFCRSVWGTERVAKRTVWSLCHRVTEKLSEVGYPGRCGTDGDEVVLC